MGNNLEVNEKKNRIRNLMAKLNLDAILLKKQWNFSWLTCGGINYVNIATEMGSASLLITDDEEYVICNNIEEHVWKKKGSFQNRVTRLNLLSGMKIVKRK